MVPATRISIQNTSTHYGTGPRSKSLRQVPATSPLVCADLKEGQQQHQNKDYNNTNFSFIGRSLQYGLKSSGGQTQSRLKINVIYWEMN